MEVQNVPAAAEKILQKNIVPVQFFHVTSEREWNIVILVMNTHVKNMTSGKKIHL